MNDQAKLMVTCILILDDAFSFKTKHVMRSNVIFPMLIFFNIPIYKI